jgi:MtN3 and saliva related transmembrane protein
MPLIELLGLVAGALSCVSFVPQLLKLLREKNAEGISRRMYFVTVSAFTLWTLYGVSLGRWALIIANGVCLLLSISILALQIRYTRKQGARSAPYGAK